VVTTLRRIYGFHFQNERRERLFLASLGFLLTFAIVRVITHLIRAGIGPFHNVSSGGLHIHHLVWGIVLLLVVGYVWLVEAGTTSSLLSSLTAVAFGVGAALTLDEFALWLNLQDVYWTGPGRASIDAVVIFASLLSVGIWGGPFLREITLHLFRRPKPA
jgi:ABC-type phosphate transport system permease subunit